MNFFLIGCVCRATFFVGLAGEEGMVYTHCRVGTFMRDFCKSLLRMTTSMSFTGGET